MKDKPKELTLSEKRRAAAMKSAAVRQKKASKIPHVHIYIKASDADRLRDISAATGKTMVDSLTGIIDHYQQPQ